MGSTSICIWKIYAFCSWIKYHRNTIKICVHFGIRRLQTSQLTYLYLFVNQVTYLLCIPIPSNFDIIPLFTFLFIMLFEWQESRICICWLRSRIFLQQFINLRVSSHIGQINLKPQLIYCVCFNFFLIRVLKSLQGSIPYIRILACSSINILAVLRRKYLFCHWERQVSGKNI